MESRNTSEEDLVVIVIEHDITSHEEGDAIDVNGMKRVLVHIGTPILKRVGTSPEITERRLIS